MTNLLAVVISVLEVEAQIILIVLVGILSSSLKLIGRKGIYALNRFSTYISAPAVFLVRLSKVDYYSLDYKILGAFLCVRIIYWLFFTFILVISDRFSLVKLFSYAASATWGNDIVIGIPLVVSVLGEDAEYIALASSLVDRLLTLPFAWGIMEIFRYKQEKKRKECGYGDYAKEITLEESQSEARINSPEKTLKDGKQSIEMQPTVTKRIHFTDIEVHHRPIDKEEEVFMDLPPSPGIIKNNNLIRPQSPQDEMKVRTLLDLYMGEEEETDIVSKEIEEIPICESVPIKIIAKILFKRVALHPLIIAAVLAVIISLCHAELPSVIIAPTAEAFSNCITGVSLFIVGATLPERLKSLSDLKDKELLFNVGIRLLFKHIVSFLLTIGFAYLFGFSNTVCVGICLISALPMARTVFGIATEFNVYVKELSLVLLLGLLVFIPLLPAQAVLVALLWPTETPI
ncbi:Membrane transport protein like protein [Aduncisulcus paluster]|uniref:Membrane transport protein like protein n=1 Tax=Aduncisulcus paluster TaxID=2918883 RepID=A0ABQ5KXT6_9EUKA|nr:Membrane transport protein like protein [Aduncisulcus paluster]